MKKLLSIVVPIYGDGTLVPVFYKAVLEANIQCALEFIFVCDGGGLDEEAFMKAFAERQSNVRGVFYPETSVNTLLYPLAIKKQKAISFV